FVATITVRCSSRKAASSASVMRIWSRRLTARRLRRREVGGGGPNRLAGVLGLQHGGVAGLLEDLAHEPGDAGEAQLDDQRAVLQLLDDRALLARPARAFGRDPQARAARGGHLAGARPAVDVGGGVDLGARLEVLVRDSRRL